MSSQNRVEFKSGVLQDTHLESRSIYYYNIIIIIAKNCIYKLVLEYVIQSLKFITVSFFRSWRPYCRRSVSCPSKRTPWTQREPPYRRTDNWYRNPVAFAQSPCNFIKYGDTIGMLGRQPVAVLYFALECFVFGADAKPQGSTVIMKSLFIMSSTLQLQRYKRGRLNLHVRLVHDMYNMCRHDARHPSRS